MAVRDIIEVPDPRLRQQALRVEDFGAPLLTLVNDLLDTQAARGGIGLCAPQLGSMRRVVLVHVPDDDHGLQVYVNPEIVARSRPGFIEESCHSVPGISGNVLRSTRLCLRFQDSQGDSFERDVDGIHAVCLQHEIDHLDGVLFTDRLSWLKKLRLRMQGSPVPEERSAA